MERIIPLRRSAFAIVDIAIVIITGLMVCRRQYHRHHADLKVGGHGHRGLGVVAGS